jgi:hypothetical protein
MDIDPLLLLLTNMDYQSGTKSLLTTFKTKSFQNHLERTRSFGGVWVSTLQ